MNSPFQTLSVTRYDGLIHLEINQPPSNRMTSLFFNELEGLVNRLRKEKDLTAIVISGKGRHFSSGADLEELMEMVISSASMDPSKDSFSFFDKNYLSFLFFEELKIPVISAIRGVCLGAAMELALSCHFRFCGEDAVLGLPESTYNLMPGIGGTSRIVKLAGMARGLELALHGNTFSAEEALRLGVVDKIVPRRQVVSYAMDFAKKISGNYHKEKRPLYLNTVALHETV